MRASTGGHVFHGLSSNDLVVRYIAKSIIRSPKGQLHLSKLQVLSDPWLMFELSARLVDHLNEGVTTICALASSGLAIGVCTALIARLPLTFFHHAGFPIPESHGLGSRFRPNRSMKANIALVDSHEHTRYTSALCHDELEEYKQIYVTQSMVPFSFDKLVDPNNHRNMTYTVLRRFSDTIDEVIQTRLDLTRTELISSVENPRSKFWIYPPLDKGPDLLSEFIVPGIRRRPQYFLGRGTDLALVKRISPEIEKLCSWINPNDDGVWEFFLRPSFVREFALLAGAELQIENYDFLVGVGHLGTAVAIAIAYHNQDKFNGSIISSLGDYGLIPQSPSMTGAKVLPIEMRVKTGVFAVDVYERLKKHGAVMKNYVSVFQPSKPRDMFELSRQTSIGRLLSRGVNIFSLA